MHKHREFSPKISAKTTQNQAPRPTGKPPRTAPHDQQQNRCTMVTNKFSDKQKALLQEMINSIKQSNKDLERPSIKNKLIIAQKGINDKEFHKDEEELIRHYIKEYKAEKVKEDIRKKERALLSSQKKRERKIYDNQKYIMGGLFFAYMKKSMEKEEDYYNAMYFLLSLLNLAKSSDMEKLKPIVNPMMKDERLKGKLNSSILGEEKFKKLKELLDEYKEKF